VAKDVFRRYLPPNIYERAAEVLDGQYSGEVGFNPGSQMVQIAGIAVLNDLDHYTKERLHIKWYLRYMDDLIIIHPDKQYVEHCFDRIRGELDKIGFTMHPEKSKIYPIKNGIKFLGFKFTVTDTGKVLMRVLKEKVQAEKRRLRRLVKRVKAGKMTKQKCDEMYQCWRGTLKKRGTAHKKREDFGDNFKVVKSMDEYYKNLWR